MTGSSATMLTALTIRPRLFPRGWRNRLVMVSGENTRDARGWCLEVHDLAIAKYVAGRGKDILFTKALAKHGMTRRNVLGERLTDTKINDVGRRLAEARIAADFAVV